MKLAVWTYEGPPHVGAMRVATAMKGVHYVLHAPQGDTYADLLFTMIERRQTRPPVTYTTFQARDLGGDTAGLFQTAVREAVERFAPEALLVGASCTAELIQDDPGGLASAIGLTIPVIQLELPSYQKKENWGAAETFYRIVRTLASAPPKVRPAASASRRPTCNLLGPLALGFRHRDDVTEVRRLLADLGIDVAVVAPEGATVADIARLPEADFNVVLYPEIARPAAEWLAKTYGQPMVTTVPIGSGATRDFIAEVCRVAGIAQPALAGADGEARLGLRAPWYARSVDSNYLTNKSVFIFGDATHAIAAARIATQEFGFRVVGLGTYARELAREVRAAAALYGIEALITDDYLEVEAKIAALSPELVLGTQMERHVAKRLGIPSAVISAPVHVQDFPARYAPQMGPEGANVIFDTWVHPLMMGLEEHLITLFRDDFEFNEERGASHLSGHAPSGNAQPDTKASPAEAPASRPMSTTSDQPAHGARETVTAAAPTSDKPLAITWSRDAEAELKKIPFFVRGKARRNTESFAAANGCAVITLETLYDAKAHYGR